MYQVTLIVESSLSSARSLQHMVEEIGYACRIVSSGEQALKAAEAARPALVIADASLPDMTGYQLAARIKASSTLQQTPVILVDSLFDADDLIRGLISGADDFMLKPYDRDSVQDVLQRTLPGPSRESSSHNGMGVEITYRGSKHLLKTNPVKAIEALLSTHELTVRRVGQLLDNQETLQRRTDEAVNSQRFLDSMLENNPNLISIKDADTLRYVRINKAFEKLTGIHRDEIIGRSDAELFPFADADLCVAIDNRALHQEGVLEVHEAVVHTRRNDQRVLRMKKIAVRGEDGKPSHLLGIAEDVTLKSGLEALVKKLNGKLSEQVAKLDATRKELEATNKDLESFGYSVAHDLRSPLNVMGGYVGLLQKRLAGKDDEKSLHYLRTLEKSVRQMDALINDLLAFSKLSRQALQKTQVDMEELVRKTVAYTLQHRPHGSIPDVELGTIPLANADSALITQVWVNLISNAVKYSGKAQKPRIQISGRLEGPELIYSVSDNGAGFDMAQYDKLFGIFQRLHGSQDFEGTGIGLAIVHRIVMHHGGRVWAEGKVNEGATFHFSLPAGHLS